MNGGVCVCVCKIISAICNNIHEAEWHFAKWNKTKTNTVWYHLYLESEEKKKVQTHRNIEWWLPGSCEWLKEGKVGKGFKQNWSLRWVRSEDVKYTTVYNIV